MLRQHLTCVRAAQAICGGKLEGDELGSSRILFIPSKVKAGEYTFSISTAGSTSLVCQTILLPLALTGGPSRVTFEGGTHNGLAPSVTFLQWSFLPVLKLMGLHTEVSFERYGFNPAGGGRWQLDIRPVTQFKSLDLVVNSGTTLSATAIVSLLPESIAQRELKTVCKLLENEDIQQDVKIVDSAGPGNTLILRQQHSTHSLVFERVGEFGVSAERVAKRTVGRLKKLMRAVAAVDEYLADQLLLPMLVAGGGRFTTVEPSLHTKTNIDVIQQFTGTRFELTYLAEHLWQVSLNATSFPSRMLTGKQRNVLS